MLTRPYLNQSKTDVILPTGTQLRGVVTQAKPARSLDRNGTLRFAFRQIVLPSGSLENMHGQMTAVEGASGQNVTVDSEGGAKANSAQGKFVAPLLLGALASNSLDSDQNSVHAGVSSNGFGLVTRIIAFAVVTPVMTASFAYYSAGKSVTRRWLMRGHDVVFEEHPHAIGCYRPVGRLFMLQIGSALLFDKSTELKALHLRGGRDMFHVPRICPVKCGSQLRRESLR